MNRGAMGSLRWLFQVAAEHKVKLWFSMLLASVSAVFALAPFYFVYLVLDHLLGGELAAAEIFLWCGLAVGCMLIRYALMMVALMLSHKSAFAIQYKVRTLALGHMAKLPLGFFSQRSSGQVKKILSEDVERIELFVAHHLPDTASALITPLVVFVYMLAVDWRMALVALIPLPLAIISQGFLYRGVEEKTQRYHETLEQLNASVIEYVRAMPVIRAFNAGGKPHTLFTDSLAAYRELVMNWIKDSGWPFAAFKTLLDCGLLVLLPVGVYFWSQGSLDIAAFTLCILLGVGMMEPLYNLCMLSGYLNQIFEGVNRLQDLLETPELSEPNQASTPADAGVDFSNVSFRYEKQGPEVLSNVSFSAPQGTLTAIVGPSGAGKSTIAMLLARFWDVSDGEIQIGGKNICSLGSEVLMNQVAFVFQDSFMLGQSVRDNIAMGIKATDEQIIAAAKAAQAHEFISALPDGYDTQLGETVTLSGGEKQRIAIARAVLKDAPILILDEATAYADANNQAQIQSALSRLIANKTVFVIAHRLSTIVGADNILVMDQGCLVGSGTHEQLLESNDVYQALWASHQQSRQWELSTRTVCQNESHQQEELINA
ncbi:ABC transporter ATP-binding protein [Photobacterium sp. J15]|uniref:ABC transporter ATP-binding protein n=1 Tax=Photobacterium sp. J15 TaxID=265901 RepID=UPI0007E48751|nr:ABC transporter ATP-binding protein [Photobacterium sp. J15]